MKVHLAVEKMIRCLHLCQLLHLVATTVAVSVTLL